MNKISTDRIHVHSHIYGGWVVRKEGARRAIKRFESQIKAIVFAVPFTHQGFDVVVHDDSGYVVEWIKAAKAA